MRHVIHTVALTLALLPIAGSLAQSDNKISQADLLRRTIDLDRLTQPPPAGEHSGLFSSHDRRQRETQDGRYIHWDADNDRGHFLRTITGDWAVMAEIKQPGALTRIWCDKPTGRIRIIIDDEIAIDAAMPDLFSGVVEPFGEPLSYFMQGDRGATLYFPIGFAQSCRVLCQEFAGEYQIDYTTFALGTHVQPFRPNLDDEARTALDEVTAAFANGLSEKQLFGAQRTAWYGGAPGEPLKTGEKFTWDLSGGGTVRALYVAMTDRNPSRDLYVLHKVIVRITYDGQSTPAIEVPLAQFFGTGYDRNLFRSLAMGTNLGTSMPGRFPTESWFMYCYFPMPFSKGMRIEFENLNRRALNMMFYMRVVREAPPEDALRFRVQSFTQNPCQVFDIPVLQATGPGRFVGMTLNVDCPREDWWGTGDHKMWIDGEQFPSILGTSTPGYFGNVRGLVLAKHALHGATVVSPVGKSSLYRWQIGDCVNFDKSLRCTLENWQTDQANDVYYNTVAYWYGAADAAVQTKRLREEDLALPGLRIPGAVEIEGNVQGKNWGHLYKQKHAGGNELSAKAAATITTREPVAINLPWKKPGRYQLLLRVLTGRSFDSVIVRNAQGELIGQVDYDRRDDGLYPVGEITIGTDPVQLSLECTRTVILDCFVLRPVEEQ